MAEVDRQKVDEHGFYEGELEMDLPNFDDDDDDDDADNTNASTAASAAPTETREQRAARYTASLKAVTEVSREHLHNDRNVADMKEWLEGIRNPCDPVGTIDRIHVNSLTSDEFQQRYVATGTPCIILGVTDSWPAKHKWASADAFLAAYGDLEMKVGEIVPFHGFGKPMPIRLAMDMYFEYTQANKVDSPVYCFERDLSGPRARLMQDFTPPPFFMDDVLNMSTAARACLHEHKYFVCGGPRSGSTMHVDPMFTGAWNTVVSGTKKWVLFPPGTDDAYKTTIGTGSKQLQQQPPAYWWLDYYPRLKASGEGARLGMVECTQNAGETIFVPSGWWHGVLNVDYSVAITQNLLPPACLTQVWPAMREWEEFAGWFGKMLLQCRPDVAALFPDIAAFVAGLEDQTPVDEDLCPYAGKG